MEAASAEMVEPILQDPTDELRGREVVSVLGPVIDGTSVMQRLSYHCGYHQGQAYLIRTASGFPRS